MKALFVDTAGWVMLADGRDPQHAVARTARDEWLAAAGTLVSSDFVMDETLTLLRVRLGLDAAERWWEQVSGSPRLRWEWIDPERAEKARSSSLSACSLPASMRTRFRRWWTTSLRGAPAMSRSFSQEETAIL